MKTTLILGGTGLVGSTLVRQLIARGETGIRVLTRHPEKTVLPAGAVAVKGDLLNPETVRTVFRDVDRVFMLNATGPTENHEGHLGIVGAQMAGVRRFVYLSVHRLQECPPNIPHLASKFSLELALKASGMEWTIVRPNNFFQNDAWFKEPLLNYNIYPQPIGDVGLSRVDVRDIAEAAAIVLTQPGHAGQVYELVGPGILTGSSTAEIWSRALGRKIQYAGNDLDQWENTFRPYFLPWQLFDYRLMYSWFQSKGLMATNEEVARLCKLLGRAPRSFEDYAAETAAAWKQERNAAA
jgi:uncharacterized protein YbjT (DUF2867 family)